MKRFTLVGPVTSKQIIIEDDEMLIFSVMKIEDYENARYHDNGDDHGDEAGDTVSE